MKFRCALLCGTSLLADCFRHSLGPQEEISWNWCGTTTKELLSRVRTAEPDVLVVLADAIPAEIERALDAAGRRWPEATTAFATDGRPLPSELLSAVACCDARVDVSSGSSPSGESFLRQMSRARPGGSAEATVRASRAVSLSEREREVLVLLGSGHSARDAARVLGLHPRSIDSCRRRLQDRLGLPSMASLAKFCLREGLIPLDGGAEEPSERERQRMSPTTPSSVRDGRTQQKRRQPSAET